MSLGLRHGWKPAYAKAIVTMRERGEAPSYPIIVTDCWPLAAWLRKHLDWPVLVCDPPERRFDLSIVHGLDVVAVHIDNAPSAKWIEQINAHTPRSLEIHEALSFTRDLERHLRALLARGTA